MENCHALEMTHQSTSPAREPHESILVTAIGHAFLARATFSTINDGLHNNSLSNTVLDRHALSKLFNDTAEFVSDSQRYGFSSDRVRVRMSWAKTGTSHIFMKVLFSRLSTARF
jgi:hypothetical protein